MCIYCMMVFFFSFVGLLYSIGCCVFCYDEVRGWCVYIASWFLKWIYTGKGSTTITLFLLNVGKSERDQWVFPVVDYYAAVDILYSSYFHIQSHSLVIYFYCDSLAIYVVHFRVQSISEKISVKLRVRGERSGIFSFILPFRITKSFSHSLSYHLKLCVLLYISFAMCEIYTYLQIQNFRVRVLSKF